MIDRRAVVSAPLLLLPGCYGTPEKRYPPVRFRMTVTIQTPKWVQRASGVIEASYKITADTLFFDPMFITAIRGQGIPLHLPDGRLLVAILPRVGREVDNASSAGSYPLAFQKPKPGNASDKFDEEYREMRRHTQAVSLSPDQMPFLLLFNDRNDPASYRVITPDTFPDIAGEGYQIKSVIVQLTNAPVTTGLEKVLPWIAGPIRQLEEGVIGSPPKTELPLLSTHAFWSRGEM